MCECEKHTDIKGDFGCPICWLEERRQISKALKLEGLAGEDIAPIAYVLAAIEGLQAELDTANEANKRLRTFARHVIRQECWSVYDLDGGDIQELAEKLELIVPHTATIEDVDCECDYEVGDTVFMFSKALKEVSP